MNFRPNLLVISSVAVLWLALCVLGSYRLAVYENTPAVASHGLANWPDLGLPRGPAYTLVLVIHPQCPCTRATLQELAVALTHCPNLQADLLFIKPEGTSESWVKSDLWSTASKLPRCSLIVDEGAQLSSAFRARSSGQSYLYGPSGKLIYGGGMTESRGHAGDNEGLTSIINLVNGQALTAKDYPVFGCPLFGGICTSNSRNWQCKRASTL
jgi:hypothetical protein